MPQKRFIVTLSRAERKQLEETVSKGKGAAHRIKHANILLAADEKGPNLKDEDIAIAFRCHRNTVANVRQRFVEQGLDEALDRKNARPRRFRENWTVAERQGSLPWLAAPRRKAGPSGPCNCWPTPW